MYHILYIKHLCILHYIYHTLNIILLYIKNEEPPTALQIQLPVIAYIHCVSRQESISSFDIWQLNAWFLSIWQQVV